MGYNNEDDYEDKIGIKINGAEYCLTKDILQKYLNKSKKSPA